MSGDQQKDAVEKYASAIQIFLTGNQWVRESVARNIIEPIATELSKSTDSSTANDYLYTLWNAILDIVQAIKQPYDLNEQPMISGRADEILDGVKGFLDTIRAAPKQFKDIPASGTAKIAELPGFGATVRDRFNGPSEESPDAWIDLNAFLAILWSGCDPETKYTSPKAFDYGLYAIWSLRDALETEQNSEQLNVLVPAAAAWISIAAIPLAQSSRSGRNFPASGKTGAPARAGPLLAAAMEGQGKDPKLVDGFDSTRLAFWEDRFRTLSENDGLNADVRSIARAAADKMARGGT